MHRELKLLKAESKALLQRIESIEHILARQKRSHFDAARLRTLAMVNAEPGMTAYKLTTKHNLNYSMIKDSTVATHLKWLHLRGYVRKETGRATNNSTCAYWYSTPAGLLYELSSESSP